ncbi:hypothetical protein [Sinorhizobium sp. GL28]|uniref:hypothetical protein n=1 Tax=Sinorhizobium sp. GL28 TaxID=1358418 RepID=UPI00071D98C3|nr:hypothetical protein [Sinorhizobium sp. GL28]KSV84376.1 hypothetical protein N184_33965 [Sinorhizobium sp. GL28]
MSRKATKAKLAQVRRPPWQLLMTSVREDAPALSTETNNALTRIFELLPHLGGLTVQTTSGDIRVTREFASGYAAELDRMLADIFRHDPAVNGIVVPATGTAPEHTATRENPYWSPDGKTLAAIDAALAAGEITPLDAIARMRAVNTRS